MGVLKDGMSFKKGSGVFLNRLGSRDLDNQRYCPSKWYEERVVHGRIHGWIGGKECCTCKVSQSKATE